MLCKKPFAKGGALFPCGQCIPCRINRRRVWTHRIMLESLQHDVNSFVTLTYEDEGIPVTKEGIPSLRKEDAQDWLKRLRRKLEPLKVRYYLVGEYGDVSWRPHYHVILFGFQSCRFGMTRPRARCCFSCDLVRDTWSHGNIFLGELTIQSAAYVAGYVTKKLTDKADTRLHGRSPEFATMSLKPGIGGDAMWDVASTVLAFGLDDAGDVPAGLRHGAKIMPLGRYLRRRLRTFVGKEAAAPDETLAEIKEELRPVREAAFEASRSFAEVAVEVNAAASGSLINKANIYKKRGAL